MIIQTVELELIFVYTIINNCCDCYDYLGPVWFSK